MELYACAQFILFIAYGVNLEWNFKSIMATGRKKSHRFGCFYGIRGF